MLGLRAKLTDLLMVTSGKKGPAELILLRGCEWSKGQASVYRSNFSSELKDLFLQVVAVAAETQVPALDLLSKLPPLQAVCQAQGHGASGHSLQPMTWRGEGPAPSL